VEPQPFDAFFRDNYHAVLRFAERRIDTEAAQDITAECFAIAWKKFDPDSPFGRAWLYQTAHHLVGNAYRKRGKHRDLLDRLHRERPADPSTDEQDRVISALARLSMQDREALQLTYWEDLSAAEVGIVLGCSEQAAWKRISRAKVRLRSILERVSESSGRGEDTHV
jgi:RNA polymerase sigma factor (sigma-70 family)